MQESFDIPDKIAKKAENATQNLLPKNSTDAYDKQNDKLLN